MAKKLAHSKSKQVPGLTPYCLACQRNLSGEHCPKHKVKIEKCPETESHIYKVYVHKPGTKNSRMTRNIGTKNFEEARLLALQFRAEVKAGYVEPRHIAQPLQNLQNDAGSMPLSVAIAKYIAHLEGGSDYSDYHRTRSKPYIDSIKLACKVLIKSLSNDGTGNDLRMGDINKSHLDKIYILLKAKKFKNRSLNKYFGIFRSLFKWYKEEFNYAGKNWFSIYEKKPEGGNILVPTAEEFEALLKQITRDNGRRKYPGEKDSRYLYRDYCVPAFFFAAHCGRRREEIIQAKISDIIEEDGNLYIRFLDLKSNRIRGVIGKEGEREVYVPVTPALRKFLDMIEYEKHKHQPERYLIAPEVQRERNRIMCDILTRSFSHYWKQISDKPITFKSLRKAFATAADIHSPGNAQAITGHSSQAVLREKYIMQLRKAKKFEDLEVFPKAEGKEAKANDQNQSIER